jgi:CheY-like chemotaxis protein
MQPARIVVIDDNPADILLLRLALDQEHEDYELEILKDGEEALQFVQDHRKGVREPEPCVIVLDLNLPFYDGMGLLRAIRNAPALEHIHVVVWSTLLRPDQEVEVTSLGAIYKTKPFGLSKLAELASEIMAICKDIPNAKSLSQ